MKLLSLQIYTWISGSRVLCIYMAINLSLRLYKNTYRARQYGLAAVRQLDLSNPKSHRLFSGSASRLGTKESGEIFQPTPTLSLDAVDGETLANSGVEKAHEAVDMVSLGLGGYWPSGLIQNALEVLYNHAHLPWWGSIFALTVLLRLSVLPLAVKMQVVAAKLAVVNKDAKVIHAKIQECKTSGDKVNEAKAGVEMMKLYQSHNVHPLAMLPLGFAQVPIFLSMFRGLRGMADLPMESLKTGGDLWFVDLTVPDPLFALPVLACCSFLVNIQVGGISLLHAW